MKPNNYLPIKCANRSSFFRAWVEMMATSHKLAARQMDVFARVLEQDYIFEQKVKDPDVALELLWTNSSRKDMRESLGMSQPHFNLALTELRRAGVLLGEDDKINPKYKPHLTEDPRFGLLVLFDWSSPSNPSTGG